MSRSAHGPSDAAISLEGFIGRYTPQIAEQAREAIAKLRAIVPAADLLVYDNYNALAVGFSANEKASGIVFSVTLYPRWVSLFFGRGVELEDPAGLLKGSGSKIRHIVLDSDATLNRPAVQALLQGALDIAQPPMPGEGAGQVRIKSISAKQRPRRPA